MDTVSSTLTVTFQAPYWVGIWARTSQGVTQYARIVFGAEPRDYDVYAWVLTKHRTLRFKIGRAHV